MDGDGRDMDRLIEGDREKPPPRLMPPPRIPPPRMPPPPRNPPRANSSLAGNVTKASMHVIPITF